jgi:extracellular factor (EF) 3-hydroxypalmitic acid methyl ester biosynthesis protein
MLEQAIVAACDRCDTGIGAGNIEESMTAFVDALAVTRAALAPPEWRSAAALFAAHPVHDRFLHDPYTANAYRKERGYAGDADTLDFVYRYRLAPADTTPLGRRLFEITTDAPIACAVRARCRYLSDCIGARLAAQPETTIVSVACGHMRELEGLDWPAPGAQIYGLDHDPASLDRLARLRGRAVAARRASVRQILARAETVPRADLIYAAGLFDYLDDRTGTLLIRRLRTRLNAGGTLIVTNLTRRNEEIAYMEAIMNWWMVYRDEAELRRLVAGSESTLRTCTLMDGRISCLELSA